MSYSRSFVQNKMKEGYIQKQLWKRSRALCLSIGGYSWAQQQSEIEKRKHRIVQFLRTHPQMSDVLPVRPGRLSQRADPGAWQAPMVARARLSNQTRELVLLRWLWSHISFQHQPPLCSLWAALRGAGSCSVAPPGWSDAFMERGSTPFLNAW